jgi:glycosyltransferase involved in cell wall biosynthesis
VISVVVTARDERAEIVNRTVNGLRATMPPREREIVVIDDGSVDPVRGLPREVHVIRNSESIGVARARHQGASVTSGDVLVWLDAHMTFGPYWLDRLLEHVDSGALLCSAFWNYERSVCHGFGADFVWCGERDYPNQRFPGLSLRHRLAYPGRGAVDVPMVIGACYAMLRSAYDALGGWSPLSRTWGGNEQELSARAWLAGFGAKCVTGATVGHLWRPQFPYSVQFDHLEFNQLVLLRTIFEEDTVDMLEPLFHPISERVRRWLEEAPVAEWRGVVQRTRCIGDRAFFSRFIPALAHQVESLAGAVRR